MRFYSNSILPALLTAIAIAHCANGVSIQARDAELAVREVSSNKATFEYEGGELMAPHDVELVRRVSWTYNNSKLQFWSTSPVQRLTCNIDQKLFMSSIVANAGKAVLSRRSFH